MTEHSQSEEQLPIDIDYAKFLDWLIDRQRISRNWHTLLKSARTLTRAALSITPPKLQHSLNIPSLSPHQNLPYHTVRKVFHSLTDSHAPPEWGSPEKDLLGRYKSPLHRAWSDAVSAFEKKHVYLADAAQQLVRNTDVEAPAIKATIAKLNNDVADAVRKEGPSIRAAQEAQQRFEEACQEFDLTDGAGDFQSQLSDEVERRVPRVLAAAVHAVKEDTFANALAYYMDFVQHLTGGSNVDLCKTVKQVREGDIDDLIAKVVTGEETAAIQREDGYNIDMSAPLHDENDTAEIDWGIEIDTSGIAVDANQESHNVEILTASDGINRDLGQSVSTGEIDWNEGVTSSEATTVAVDGNNSNAESVTLADPSVRERFLTDLLELDAFLIQRIAELSRWADSELGLVLQQSTSIPDWIKRVDAERVVELRGALEQAIDRINSDETRQLLALQSNRKRIERAARAVVEKKHVAERMKGAIVILRERRAKAGQQLSVEGPRLEEIGKVTREAKRHTEEALSGLYRGRSVNILGEINSVFPPKD